MRMEIARGDSSMLEDVNTVENKIESESMRWLIRTIWSGVELMNLGVFDII
jgi:hypothetical protein